MNALRGILVGAALCFALGVGALAQGITSMFPGPGTPASAGGGGAITFDNAADLGNNGGSGNFSTSYTGSSLSNGLMVLCVVGTDGTTDSNPVATYNSVSLTKAISAPGVVSGVRFTYLFYLLNPASGAHTLAITQTGGNFLIATVAEYAGAKQTAQPDATAHGDNQSSPATVAITVANANSWAMACSQTTGANMSASGAVNTVRKSDGSFNNLYQYDSNGGLTTGSKSSTYTGDNFINIAEATFQPN